MNKIISTSKAGDILHALMTFNGLGVSGNKRTLQAQLVTVNAKLVTDPKTPVVKGDKVTVGRNQEFEVV